MTHSEYLDMLEEQRLSDIEKQKRMENLTPLRIYDSLMEVDVALFEELSEKWFDLSAEEVGCIVCKHLTPKLESLV